MLSGCLVEVFFWRFVCVHLEGDRAIEGQVSGEFRYSIWGLSGGTGKDCWGEGRLKWMGGRMER